MSLVVKICGLSTAETLDAALAAGSDMVGFVFFPPSPRSISFEAARVLARRVPRQTRKVALVVDADDDWLSAIADTLAPDLFQLHGKETPERVSTIRERFQRPVVKAIGVAAAGDLAAIAPYSAHADHILVDAKPPRDAAYPGGHGRPFDWSILEAEHPVLDPGRRFMLSGGLNVGNVVEAVRRTRPWGVDVSSGVEQAPGLKDVSKIAAFVAAARAADRPDPESVAAKPGGVQTW